MRVTIDVDVETVKKACEVVVAVAKYQDEANAARLVIVRAVLDAIEETDPA